MCVCIYSLYVYKNTYNVNIYMCVYKRSASKIVAIMPIRVGDDREITII